MDTSISKAPIFFLRMAKSISSKHHKTSEEHISKKQKKSEKKPIDTQEPTTDTRAKHGISTASPRKFPSSEGTS